MQPIEIAVIICSVLIVIGVIVWAIVRKKQGKSTCGCGECDGNCEKCKEAILKAREQIKKKNQVNEK